MTAEFFDGAMPIPQSEPGLLIGIAGADDGPTLEMALKRVGADGRDDSDHATLFERPETAPDDLWISALEAGRRGGPVEPRELSPDELALISGSNVTVVGPPPYEPDYWDENPYDPGDNDPYPDGGGGGGGGGGDGEPGPSAGSIEERVTIDDSIPPEQRARAEQAEQQLEAQMRLIDAKIQALGDNDLVRVGDRTYTGAEVKALWEGMSYSITWNENFGPLGGARNNNGAVEVNLDTLEIILTRNGQRDLWGADDMLLHELAHMLPDDRANYQAQWTAYLNSGGDPDINAWQNSSYFRAAETYTHGWAVAIGTQTGVAGYQP